MDEPFIFIVNPAAGDEAAVRVWPRIERVLAEEKVTYEAVATYSAEEGEAVARQWAARPARAIIAVGGDGTMHSVANGLLRASQAGSGYLPLGVVPVGHRNYFARALGQNSGDPVEAARGLMTSWPRPLDVGLLRSDLWPGEERFFVFRLGMALDAHLTATVEQQGQTRSGLRRAAKLWNSIRAHAPAPICLTTGGLVRELEVAMITIGTALRYAERYFAADVETEEGVLELCLVRSMSSYALSRLVSQARQGKPLRQVEVTVEQVTRVTIECERSQLLQADGEVLGEVARVEVEILPGRLPVLR